MKLNLLLLFAFGGYIIYCETINLGDENKLRIPIQILDNFEPNDQIWFHANVHPPPNEANACSWSFQQDQRGWGEGQINIVKGGVRACFSGVLNIKTIENLNLYFACIDNTNMGSIR